MKTFADYLPTLTAREREIVEAFHLATEAWHDDDNPVTGCPIAEMRYTPPAKEPESVETVIRSDHTGSGFIPSSVIPLNWHVADRVRVTKLENSNDN